MKETGIGCCVSTGLLPRFDDDLRSQDTGGKDNKFGNTPQKNGAARLDPWEIFVLLALEIPFHFISLRKLENYIQFYMRITFKLNRTKEKSSP